MPDGITIGADGVSRCAWAGAHADYCAYHDEEWGFPVADDVALFEKLSLEGFQAGLSWLTILRKRERFRAAFAGFDFRVVAGYTPDDVARLLGDVGIVRHRGKIEAVIHNAGRAVELVLAEGSLAAYVWSFAPPTPFTADCSRSARHAHHLSGGERAGQGPQAPRLALRGPDDRLCLHAVDGSHRRSRRRLRVPRSSRGGPRRIQRSSGSHTIPSSRRSACAGSARSCSACPDMTSAQTAASNASSLPAARSSRGRRWWGNHCCRWGVT